jgi:hypothetical protein
MEYTYEWARKYRESLQKNYLSAYHKFWRPLDKFMDTILQSSESPSMHAEPSGEPQERSKKKWPSDAIPF